MEECFSKLKDKLIEIFKAANCKRHLEKEDESVHCKYLSISPNNELVHQ